MEFWGIGRQKEMIESLLDAMNDRPIGGVINIVYRRLHSLEATQEFGRAKEPQGTNSISQ